MKRLIFVFVFLFILQDASPQTSVNRKAHASFEKAQSYLREHAYELAIIQLTEALKADPNFLTAYYQLAETQLTIGEYAGAKTNYEHFINAYTGKDQNFINAAKKKLIDCVFAIEAMQKPVVYKPVNLGEGVNSKFRDYFPALTADGQNIIFSRNIEGNEDFYIAHKQNEIWGQAQPLSNKINTIRFNEGAQSISPDGRYLFFTGCNRPDGLGRCDIYVSEKKGKDWSEPFNLGTPINSPYWDSQPAINPSGDMLYFVSNRPGGLGGYDIWRSELGDDGSWKQPENMGPGINTPYDEHTPFIHPDGNTLYFSSNGWPGMGNKDIFYCRADTSGKWGTPLNLGFPINTHLEETGLIVTPDGKQGLFSAQLKDGMGDMDIYSFDMPENTRPKPITYVKGIVKDKDDDHTIEAKIEVTDLKTGKSKFSDYTAEDGSFMAIMPIGSSYALHATSEGYLFHSENFELRTKHQNIPFLIEIYLEKIRTGSMMTLKNVFFNTNEYELLPASLEELSTLIQLLISNKYTGIEIQGHTDNIGDQKANEKLSLLRAKAVYDYLISNGIAADRLSYKGYGESKSLATNDTEEGRKQNRRTSFVITKI